ncbi:MAG: AAA family ATPase [Chitinophagaceae bacterium]|nr:AAA family ATPase [Chitinophagaceae bacterium]
MSTKIRQTDEIKAEFEQSFSSDLNEFIQTEGGDVVAPKTLLERYEYLRITDQTDVPDPVSVVTIAGQVMCTGGNLTTISGASKSGKSALTGVTIAGAIAPGDYDGFPDLYIQPNSEGKAIIHIDTEQARSKHKRNLCRILDRAGVRACPDYLLSYNIRQLSLDEYKAVTDGIVQAASLRYGGIHLMVIDGIADYIRDVNDPEDSNDIVNYFERIAVTYECPVIVVVHTNPGSDKQRGHLGSQLQRKSESVLNITTEADISTIQPQFLRNAGSGQIPLIQYRYDPLKHYHVYCGIKSDTQAAKDEQRLSFIRDVASKVFGAQKAYSYKEAIEAIMRESKKGETNSKGFFKEMRAHKMITQGDDDLWRM